MVSTNVETMVFLLQGHSISARIILKDIKRCVNDASFVRRYD